MIQSEIERKQKASKNARQFYTVKLIKHILIVFKKGKDSLQMKEWVEKWTIVLCG